MVRQRIFRYNSKSATHKKKKPQWNNNTQPQEWLNTKETSNIKISVRIWKTNPHTLLVRMSVWKAVWQFLSVYLAIQPSNSNPCNPPKKNKSIYSPNDLHTNVHSTIFYNSQKMETIYMPIKTLSYVIQLIIIVLFSLNLGYPLNWVFTFIY